MKTTLAGAIVLFLGSACGTTSPSQTAGSSSGAVAPGAGTQWSAPSAKPGKGTAKPGEKGLTEDDFKVRVVKTVEAPIYLDGIQETAQDEFRKGVLAVTADPPNLKAGTSHFQAAIEKDPAFREAYFNLGMCLERLGEREDALDVYKSAIDRNPATPPRRPTLPNFT
jgi:hypothetical protein